MTEKDDFHATFNVLAGHVSALVRHHLGSEMVWALVVHDGEKTVAASVLGEKTADFLGESARVLAASKLIDIDLDETT